MGFEARNRVELFDGCRTQPCQGTENSTLDLCNLSILNSINKRVLCLCCVILQFLGSVLLAEWRNLVEVHLQVVRHFLSKLIFWRRHAHGLLNERRSGSQQNAFLCAALNQREVRATENGLR